MADEKNESASGGSSSAGTSPLVLVFLVLNTVGLLLIGYFQYTNAKKQAALPSVQDVIKKEMEQHQSHEGDDELEVKHKEDGIMFPLDPFSVNLAQGDGPRRYLRLIAVLRFSTNSKKDELEARKPQIRDTIISILNAKRPEDLLKKEGKVYLKDEIKAAVNSYLIDGKLEEVFYTGFQIN